MKFELSLEVGRPVAYIKGGKLNGQVVRVVDTDEEDNNRNIDLDEMDLLMQDFFRNIKERLNFVKMNRLKQSINERERPEDPELAEIYDRAIILIDGSRGKELIVKDAGRTHLTFDPEQERQVFYISGVSGAGKSKQAAELADNYHKLFPKREIYLFSNKPEDYWLDQHNFITRVPLDDDIVDIDLQLISESLVIFDDVEAVKNVKLSNGFKLSDEIARIADLILQQGRSTHVSFIYISHAAYDGKKTKIILAECHSITIFPATCSAYSLDYLLTKYFGFEKRDVPKVANLPSKSVTIFKNPGTVVYDKGVYLIK